MDPKSSAWMTDAREMLIFFSRLPIARDSAAEHHDFTRALRAAPIAGVVIGAIGAVVLGIGATTGLPSLLTAALATTAIVLATGALHEDALADVADGFGGGTSPERKLEIMRDSTIGAFGASALCLSLLIRTSAIAALIAAPNDIWQGAWTLIAAAAISRGAGVSMLGLLSPARTDGLGRMAGKLDRDTLQQLIAVTAVAGGIALWIGTGMVSAIAVLSCAAAATWGFSRLAKAQIGGQTGDVAGAAQQVVECTVLVATLSVISI